MRLEAAIVYAKDLPVLGAFYRDALDLPVTRDDPTHWELTAGHTTIVVHAIPHAIAAEIEITAPPSVREETPVKLIFAADDLAAARRRIATLGGSIVDRPWSDPARTFDAIDPEGNVFQVAASARA